MDPQAVAALVQLGVAGVILWAFLTDRLRTTEQSDERVAEVSKLWEARFREMRDDRNEWRRLALGTEKRLDAASSTVATALGAPVPSALQTPHEPHP